MNWLLESIGYNVISNVFSVKDKKEIVLSKTGHIIYFMFAFSAILCAILFFREKMYKDAVEDPLNNDEKEEEAEEEEAEEEEAEEEKETPAPTEKPTKMKSKKDKTKSK
jgi:hypothetical protein